MKLIELLAEETLGTSPKREKRPGSRPARGHEPQKRYGISKDQENNFHLKLDKLVHSTFGPSSDEVDETHDELDQYDTHGLQGYYSDFHKDLHGFRPRHHSEDEWNNPERLKELIRGLHKYMDQLKQSPEGRAQLKADGWHFDDEEQAEAALQARINEGWFDSKPKVDFKARAKELFAKGLTEQQVLQQLIKEGCPPNQAAVFVQGAQLQEHKKNRVAKKYTKKPVAPVKPGEVHAKAKAKVNPTPAPTPKPVEQKVNEKASRALCKSSKPDEDLGASNLASCKSQGLRARDGNKSHKLGKTQKSRVKVGGHKIKGQKYGGPLPDWS